MVVLLSTFFASLFFLLTTSENSQAAAPPQPPHVYLFPKLAHLSTKEVNLFMHYANIEKDKYDDRKPDSWLVFNRTTGPTVAFGYDTIHRVGTQVLFVFTNQINGTLATKAGPEWTRSWETLSNCRRKGVVGEIRRCVDSKESMIDFVTPILGGSGQITPLTTPPGNLQYYEVVGPAKTVSHHSTSCHPVMDTDLPHVIYSCHYLPNTRVLQVPLLGADGTRLEALTVCHMDTSSWNPDGIILRDVLNINPGPPVCHFSATDDIVWVRT